MDCCFGLQKRHPEALQGRRLGTEPTELEQAEKGAEVKLSTTMRFI